MEIQDERMFAVVEIAGKQYKVAPGDTITTDKVEAEVGKTLTFDRVFVVADGTKTKVGTPTVAGAKVEAKVVGQGKGEKIEVRRYKSKVRYRKHIGFRPHETSIEIVAISGK